ncbi:MAG TPA: BTAD domain-containing putative transcriptional regulator [Kribbellaceae bacterium]
MRLQHVDGQALRASKPRQLLATLLLHPNRFVSTELIADALWEGYPPASATANIRTYVRALRSALQLAGLTAPIDTSAAGYSIEVGVDELDASLFESLLAEGGHLRVAGDERQAMQAYSQALALWRGRPLEDLTPASAWEGSLARLEAQHRGLVDTLLELRLANSDHTGAALLLSDRLTEDPYDEALWAQLVDTLVAAGRLNEARSTYKKAVRTLAADLGVEPGPELAEAGARAARPAKRRTGLPRPAVVAGGDLVRVPSQLPLDLADFSGRGAELERLRDLVCGRDPVRPPIAVISGPPGTGKSALAVKLGHMVRESFPDGQIYLDMRASSQPREPSGALHDLLRSLDVPDSAVPADPERRSAALRSELASRRVLILLDDVGSASQVLPLLPGTGESALVITSRRRLTDLAGADSVPLDVLDAADAAALLSLVAGPGRVDGDDAAVAEILEACGNLPLAIRIAASRLVQRPDLAVADLARRLRDETHRLDELSLGELAVRTSADLSYGSLGPDEARLYRVLGHIAVGDFSARALDPVFGRAGTDRGLDRLIEANLVQTSSVDSTGHPRHRLHDLIRLHAVQIGTDAERAQAIEDLRLVLDAALRQCRRACAALPFEYFGVPELEPGTGDTADDDKPMTGDEALTWLDAERGTFVQLVRAAANSGLHEYAWRIAAAWGLYLDMRAGFDEWDESHQVGLASARACGNRRGEAIMHRNLGQLALYRDDWEPAYEHLTAAAEIFDAIGDRLGAGVTGVGLGTWHRERGFLDVALEHCVRAMHAFVEVGDANGEAVARSASAAIHLLRDDADTASAYLAPAFRLARLLGDPHREAKVRRRIAEVREHQGRNDQAVRQLRTALAIFEGLGDDHCASYTRASLGQALLALGDQASARRMLLAALEIGHRLGDRSAEAQAAYLLGELHRQAGHVDPARRYLGRAARVWQLVANDDRAADIRRTLATL